MSGLIIPALLFTLISCSKEDDNKKDKKSSADLVASDSSSSGSDSDSSADTDSADSDSSTDDESSSSIITGAYTKSDLEELAEKLKERVVKLNRKERDLIEREQLVSTLEITAAEQLKEADQLKKDIAGQLEQMDAKYKLMVEANDKLKIVQNLDEENKKRIAERESQILNIVETIKGMPASVGAGLLMSMDINDAVEVFKRVDSRQVANLFSQMPSTSAAEFTAAMLGPKINNNQEPVNSGTNTPDSGIK
ncbi:MAG: hypothetical protein JXR91_11205 [Deltaproteobacteria bacterium]|nr:hypothetical protein [Deltaproteobacteria bacterium]